jgi:ABC-type sugar transport system substrate-binding protein
VALETERRSDGESVLDRRSLLGKAAATTFGLATVGGLASVAQGARAAVAGGSKGTIGFNQPDSANPVVYVLYKGAQAEAKKRGYELLQSTANLQADKQIAEINTWIAEGVDAMTVLPLNADAMAPLLKRAHDAGIEFVGYVLRIPNEDGYVGFDNVRGARLLGTYTGNWVKQKLGGNAEVAILTADALGAVGKRVHDAANLMQKIAPGAKIVAHQDAITAPQAFTTTQSILQAHPNVSVMICMSDDGSVGAQQAFMQTKPSQSRQDQMAIVGFDGGERALAQILKGTVLRASAALDLYSIGRSAVWVPANILEKKKPTEAVSEPILVTYQRQAAGKKLLASYK